MTQRELVIAALNHEETTTIPYHIDFTGQSLEQLVAYTGNRDIGEQLGVCMNYIQYWGWPSEIDGRPGYFRDEFGVVWNRNGADKDIRVVEKPQIEDLEECDYRFPVCDEARLRREYEELVAGKGDRFTMAGFGFCMFERSWSLMGMENVLMSMIICPEELERLYDQICDYFCGLVDIALENKLIESILASVPRTNDSVALHQAETLTRELFHAFMQNQRAVNILFSGSRQGIFANSIEKGLRQRFEEADPTFAADLNRGILLSFCVQGCFYAFANNSSRMDEGKLVELLGAIAKTAQSIEF